MSLVLADARSIPLRDGCVQCVVTSPPYWGLRDYGTGSWVGGDPACSHAEQRGGRKPETSAKQLTNQGTVLTQYRAVCAVCAAQRVDSQIGLEAMPSEYVEKMVSVFRELYRVLKADGTAWLNLGDSYSGAIVAPGSAKQASNRGASTALGFVENGKPKDLMGIPWRVAFALQADGWYLRSDIIWAKPNPMPESVTDRPTKSHEYLFLLTKSSSYYYDAQAIAEPVSAAMVTQMEDGYDGLGLKDYAAAGVQNPSSVKARIIAGAKRRVDMVDRAGEMAVVNLHRNRERSEALLTRNRRTVWTIPTMPYAGAHFATMPEALVEPCILAGSRLGDLILDPFSGSGTVLAVAERTGRRSVGIDLNPAYHELAKERTAQRGLRFEAEV